MLLAAVGSLAPLELVSLLRLSQEVLFFKPLGKHCSFFLHSVPSSAPWVSRFVFPLETPRTPRFYFGLLASFSSLALSLQEDFSSVLSFSSLARDYAVSWLGFSFLNFQKILVP